MENLIGRDLGRYHILEQLGEGGMATVYKAFDTRLESDVAVKIIRMERFTPEVLERALKRFEREAKALARLTHPNIVKVIDYGEYEGRPFLVMPYLAGGNLKELLKKRGRLPWQEAVRLILPIARALDYAHVQNVIHRDVKPSNILITESGDPMLTDFGVAKILEEEATLDLTGTNAAVGTPEYMAPEQIDAKTVDNRADVYALGVVFYEIVTGRRPFEADTPMAVMIMQARDPLPSPKQFVDNLPENINRTLIKALAKKPEDRYSDMRTFSISLENLLGKQANVISEKTSKKTAHLTAKSGTRSEYKRAIGGTIWTSESNKFSDSSNTPANENLLSDGRRAKRRSWVSLTFLTACILLVGLVIFWFLTVAKNRRIPPINNYNIPTTTSELNIGTSFTRSDGMEMLYIPKGDFLMGSPDDQGLEGEHPQHTVTLDSFWIDKTEITNAMFALCVNAGACDPPHNGKSFTRGEYYINILYQNFPVIYVNWGQAKDYCQWAGARLPTEAEWEKAARGTDGISYPWGNNNPICLQANFHGMSGCKVDTTDVDTYSSGVSPFGLLDMAGNVWEWVGDWYDTTYYSVSTQVNPQGPLSGTSKVIRGGSYSSDVDQIRVAYRAGIPPDNRLYDIGFRCASSTEIGIPSLRDNNSSTSTLPPKQSLIPTDTLSSTKVPTPTVIPTETPTVEYTLEASAQGTSFTIQATLPWQDTKIALNTGDVVRISYISGQWTTWLGGHPLVGPTGNVNIGDPKNTNHPVPSAYPGVLIGKVGDGKPFAIGQEIIFHAASAGNLFLQMNDDNLSDNSGSIMVIITINDQ